MDSDNNLVYPKTFLFQKRTEMLSNRKDHINVFKLDLEYLIGHSKFIEIFI